MILFACNSFTLYTLCDNFLRVLNFAILLTLTFGRYELMRIYSGSDNDLCTYQAKFTFKYLPRIYTGSDRGFDATRIRMARASTAASL